MSIGADPGFLGPPLTTGCPSPPLARAWLVGNASGLISCLCITSCCRVNNENSLQIVDPQIFCNLIR